MRYVFFLILQRHLKFSYLIIYSIVRKNICNTRTCVCDHIQLPHAKSQVISQQHIMLLLCAMTSLQLWNMFLFVAY